MEKHTKIEQDLYKKLFNGKSYFGPVPWSPDPSRTVIEIMERNDLLDGKGKIALDIGCGKGRHIEFLRKCGYSVVGLDFSPDALAFCQQKFSGDKLVKLIQCDVTKEFPKDLGKFDLVLQWSVLDHLRTMYRKTYKRNIEKVVKNFFLVAEFSWMEKIFKNKKYLVREGHYSCIYSPADLTSFFDFLTKVDILEDHEEYLSKGVRFNTVLFKR